MSGNSAFFWPMLKPSELATCLNQCQLSVTDKDISHPNTDTLMEIYTTLCLLIAGESSEDFDNPCLEAIEEAEISQLSLYQEGMCELAIYNSIKKLMRAAAIPNFSIQNDLLEPAGNRTIFNLSGLINFAKFREHRLAFYSQLTQESEDLIAHREQQLEYQEQLKERLRLLQREAEESRPVLQQMTEQKAALIQEANEYNRKQTQLCEESARMKAQNQEYADRIQSIQAVIETTQGQLPQLRSGILDKPEQVVELIASLQESITKEKECKSVLERKNLHFRTKQEQLAKLQKELEKCIELLEKCKLEWDNSKACNKENSNLLSSVNEVKQKHLDAKRNMELHEKQQTLAIQRLEQSSEKYREKIGQLTKELAELDRSYKLSVKRANTELHQKIEHHRTTAREIESNLQTLSRDHHLFISTLHEQIDLLFNALAEFHGEILDQIDQFTDFS